MVELILVIIPLGLFLLAALSGSQGSGSTPPAGHSPQQRGSQRRVPPKFRPAEKLQRKTAPRKPKSDSHPDRSTATRAPSDRNSNVDDGLGQTDMTRPAIPLGRLVGPAYVIDGDTIVVAKHHIRLAGIDAPELDHPYGQVAKGAMVRLCKGQRITVDLMTDMSHGRLVGICRTEDGRDLAAELVKIGLALDWAKHSGGRYRQFEPTDARRKLWRCDARQKGRWIDANTPPSYASASRRSSN